MNKSKPNSKNINAILGSSIIILVLIALLIGAVKSFFDVNLKQSDIIKFKGEVISYKEERIGGTRSHQVGFLKINSSNLVFKVSNASRRVLKQTDFEKRLKVGEIIEIGTSKSELEKARNTRTMNKIFNAVIKTRTNPQIFYLKHQNQQLFDLDKYIELESSRKESNLFWGIPITLFFIGLFSMIIYSNWKTRYD